MNEGSGYGLESVDRHRQEVVASIREVLGSGPDVEALVEPAVRSTARRARQQELGGEQVRLSDLLRWAAYSAVEALLEVHGREVRRVVRGQVDSDADADDAEQEVRVKLLRAASEGRRLNRVRILVWAKNVVKDIWRKRSSDRRKGKAVALEPDLLMYVPQGPEAEARNRRIEDLVAAALQSVPKAQREAYVAREVLGCTYKEAAEELGKSPPTLRQLVYLARKRIRSWLVEGRLVFLGRLTGWGWGVVWRSRGDGGELGRSRVGGQRRSDACRPF